MVLDSSAVVAILLDEPEASRMADALAGATDRAISTANLLEAAMVLFSRNGTTIPAIEAELAAWGVEIVPVSYRIRLINAPASWAGCRPATKRSGSRP